MFPRLEKYLAVKSTDYFVPGLIVVPSTHVCSFSFRRSDALAARVSALMHTHRYIILKQ